MSIATPPKLGTRSLAESMSWLSDAERAELMASLSEQEARDLLFDWPVWARPDQLPPPGNWRVWLVMAGRGFGKTRIGAEWVRQRVKSFPYTNIIGATADDARDIMIEGESGILAICPPNERPAYLPSKRRLEWPNGAKTLIFTADEPERLRGKQHDGLWGDEIAAWRYGAEAWTQAMLGLRLGPNPQCVATTTPKPVTVVRGLLKRVITGDEAKDRAEKRTVALAKGTTYSNVDNLAPAFFEEIIKQYEGTRVGRQELEGELLEDVEGALWTLGLIDQHRVEKVPEGVELVVSVVAIDPAASSGETSAETGIVVVARGSDGDGYVLADYSMRGTPNEWGGAAVQAFDDYDADHVTPETNNGGEMVTSTLQTIRPTLPIIPVHASRGKATRAEPVSALYEQGRVHHVGTFPALEDQMANWVPGMKSPDRMDAVVWGLTDVMLAVPEPEEETVYYYDPVTISLY